MREIQIPMKFKVDFNSGEDYQSLFDSLVDNGLASSFSVKYIVSRVLDDKCEDGVYYFTVTKNKFIFGTYELNRVSKDTYDKLDYNIYSYRQNQWILHTDDSDEPRYCNGVKLPTPVDKIVHRKMYYYPTPTGYTKSGVIGFDVSMYEPDRITELLEANLLYENIEDSNLHSDAMLLTHSTKSVSNNETKEVLIHEHDLTEMKIKIKNDEEFMILQQYFFNRGVGWLEFSGDKQFMDNAEMLNPIKYIYIVEHEEFYMVPGHTDEKFELSTSPVGIFNVLKVIK